MCTLDFGCVDVGFWLCGRWNLVVCLSANIMVGCVTFEFGCLDV